MTAGQARRVSLLTRALSEWADFDKEGRREKPRRRSYAGEYRAFELSFGDFEIHGCLQADGYVTLDTVTGRLVARAAKAIVKAELRKLGVKA